MNVIARLEYELAYYDSAVHRFNHDSTRLLVIPKKKSKNEKPSVVDYDDLKRKLEENRVVSALKFGENFVPSADTTCRTMHEIQKYTYTLKNFPMMAWREI